MNPSIEILVHISAPSRGADDARYRAGALGFLDFEPVTRYTICPLDPPFEEPVGAKQLGNDTNLAESFLLDQLPSQIVGKSSPIVHRSLKTPAQATKKSDHQHKTPAVVPRPTPFSDFQRTSVKETPHLLIERTPALPRPRTAPTALTPSVKAQPLRRTQSDSWHTPPSVIPNSQPTPATSTLSRPAVSSSPYQKRPFESSSPSPTRPEESPSKKRQRLDFVSSSPANGGPDNERLAFGPVLPSSSPTSEGLTTTGLPVLAPEPLLSSPKVTQISTSSPTASELEAREIHPTRPTVSTAHFKTHITRSFELILERCPMRVFSRCHSFTRELDKLERGHWLVPMSNFDHHIQAKFWKSLTMLIGKQRIAGWWTWCVRELADLASPEEAGKKREEVAKIYCWGEIVGEVWLILFIASGGEVKRVGTRWIDASGEAVVVLK